nr:hypothetical protein [Tanacetum cinerariifolium]
AVVVTLGVVVARGGEWYGGSNRSGDRDRFWVRRKPSPEKFSGGEGGDGWPAVVVAGKGERRVHEKVSSIPTVLCWIDNISSDGFLPSILLLVVVIVTVIIVVVIVILIVVVAIVVVVFVVGIIGVVVIVESSSVVNLSFMIT